MAAEQRNRENCTIGELHAHGQKFLQGDAIVRVDEQKSGQTERHQYYSEVIQLHQIQKKPTLCFVHCFSLRAGL
jgi:hypothetical protein